MVYQQIEYQVRASLGRNEWVILIYYPDNAGGKSAGCRRAFCWNSMWRNLQRHEVIESSGEVNWLIDGPCGERLPAIDLAHVDLTGGEQRPEQHGGSLC